MEAPPRARALRSVCLELERIYNHIADIGAIATDVAFVVANAHAMRLKERVLRLNEQLTGSRLLRGMATLGGVRYDWNAGQVEAFDALCRASCARSSSPWSPLSATPPPPATGWKPPAFSSLKPLATSASSALPAVPPASITICAATSRTPPTTR